MHARSVIWLAVIKQNCAFSAGMKFPVVFSSQISFIPAMRGILSKKAAMMAPFRGEYSYEH